MKWKAALAVLALVTVTGCGNGANNAGNAAGNAAGFVGNTTGNVVRGTGNIIGGGANAVGNGIARTGNAVGGAFRNGVNGTGAWATGDVYSGSQTVAFNHAARRVDVRLADTTVRGNAVTGGTAAGPNNTRTGIGGTRANWASAATITVPLGWSVRVTSPKGAGWANNVYVVPYNNRTPGTAITTRDGHLLTNGHTFTAPAPGVYALVVNGTAATAAANQVVDFIQVTRHATTPSITNH
ncbi:hypothetical protein GCM10025857_32460 [Alicyclobacillus contaminans]|uniref:hypothetical protein n=1 Tax=Alicyclobacillus contaminans TaxID=392016 RepID=UPI00040A2A56|nr:hypothetical protein [Alicyclobacillus contaminans]GMA51889.1 hypothetical protein GCM10025857_32460 [Alicyclobacillus contaminans]